MTSFESVVTVSCSVILDALIHDGELAGSLTGGRQEKAIYIPTIYTKAQDDWVDSSFKQNGYLGKIYHQLIYG